MTSGDAYFVIRIKEWFSAGTAMALSSAFLNPTDVIKVRMQTDGLVKSVEFVQATQYQGFRQTAMKIFSEEGVVGLWQPGLIATCLREMSYGGLTFVFYPLFKSMLGIDSKQDASWMKKLLAGFGSGLISSAVATPTDVVKIRMQQNSGRVVNGVFTTGLFIGQKPHYRHTGHAFSSIYQQYGFSGLYKGTSPTVVRASLLIMGKMASYDQTKTFLRKKGYTEGVCMHVTAGLVSGFVATTTSAPADIAKTRLMCDPERKQYKNLLDVWFKIIRNEGPHVLFRGWWPSFVRQGPHYVISTPLMEICRRFAGLDYF